jgi:hypothetical protein
MIKFLVAMVLDALLILGALTFQDPLPAVIIAVLMFPAILLTLVMLDPRIRRGAEWDVVQMQNFYNTSQIARDVRDLNQHNRWKT